MAGQKLRLALLLGFAMPFVVAVIVIAWQESKSASANPLTGAAQLDTGDAHACIVTTSGAAKCWGSNSGGLLGDGTTNSSNIPIAVTGLSTGTGAIDGGEVHTCALTTSGGVKCWGAGFGLTPVDVTDLTSGVAAIAAGGGHTCALLTTGGVKCWGAGFGLNPVDITDLTSGVAAIAAGGGHTCALLTTGGVKCWGSNAEGQLGDGDGGNPGDGSSVPVGVLGLTSGVGAISAGSLYSCAVTTSGAVKCWGSNLQGILGDGTTTRSLIPVDVLGLTTGALDVASGTTLTCAMMTAGGVKCWGGKNGPTPVDIPYLTSVISVTTGADFACALETSGIIKCWGNNGLGQLGDGTNTSRNTPADVVELVAKPTPTNTPCPPAGCPTATPTPICPTETCMALAVLEDGSESCHSDLVSKCTISTGGSFVLAVDAVQPPAEGYVLTQALVDFGPDLIYTPATTKAEELVWPDSVIAVRSIFGNLVAVGGITGPLPPIPVSTFAGIIIEMAFTCTETETTTDVSLIPFDPPGPLATSGAAFNLPDGSRQVPTVSSLTINCSDAPPAVGGIAADGSLGRLPGESASGRTLLLVLVAVGVIPLGATGFFALRRLGR